MSQEQNRFDEFAEAIRGVMNEYDDVTASADVLISLNDTAEKSVRGRCDPPCSPPRRCVFNPRARQWVCWPPA